jgi:multiple sugar transport system permease protein
MVTTSIKPASQVATTDPSLIPTVVSFESYSDVINNTQFVTWYVNSIIYTIGVVVLTTATATFGGYGLTRLDIPFKNLFARSVLLGYMFPAIMLSIPMFVLWSNIGWINTYTGVIFAETALSLPFCLWLMWKFFQTVPESLEESARMAGATRFQTLKDIALPMALPGIITVAIYSYAVAWNEFTIPLIILSATEMWPHTIGIQSFVEGYSIQWGMVMAGTTLMTIPSFLFVYFLQSHILRGFRV